MTKDNNEKDDRRERFERRRDHTRPSDNTPRRRRDPYKREHTNYDYSFQDEEIEDEWYEHNEEQ